MKTETRTYTLYQTTELSEESKEKGSSSLLMVKSDEERLGGMSRPKRKSVC